MGAECVYLAVLTDYASGKEVDKIRALIFHRGKSCSQCKTLG
jgi:hypothetical protein